MPFHPDELSAFFDKLYRELREEWDQQVDDGHMTDHALQRRLARMDDIAALLSMLGDGKAALTYGPTLPRED